MPRHRMLSVVPGLVATALSALLLAGCGDDSDQLAPPTAAAEEPAALEVDWATRTVTGTSGSGVAVEFCEGEAPYLCFTGDGDDHLGIVELVHHPTAGYDAIDDTSAGGRGHHPDVLEALADDFVTSMSIDRAEGCGTSYRVVSEAPVPAVVAGQDGVRFGFRGVVDDATVEQVIIHATIVGDTLWMLTAAGYDIGGCLPRESEFDVAGLHSASTLISELAAHSTLPAADHRTTTEEG